MNMATTALAAAVAGITTVVDSAVALINDLATRLREAIEGEDWDAVEELTSELESNKAELAAAIAANTIADEGTPIETPVEDAPDEPDAEPVESGPTEPMPDDSGAAAEPESETPVE